MAALSANQLALLTARFGAARFGAARFGYTPCESVDEADTTNGPFTPYVRIYVPVTVYLQIRACCPDSEPVEEPTGEPT